MSTYTEALRSYLKNRPELLDADSRHRSWAYSKRYQRFLGIYHLHPASGLYFSANAPPEAKEAVHQVSLLLPAGLYLLALDYHLSVSFCQGPTLEGNSSTFYADFSAREKSAISPHVEISAHSLERPWLLVHWCHELGHLYFRHASWELKQKFRQFLEAEIAAGLKRELTPYAQSKLDAFLEEAEKYQTIPSSPLLRINAFLAYSEECFCETLAVLVSRNLGREHPAYLASSNADQQGRKALLEGVWGLDFSPVVDLAVV